MDIDYFVDLERELGFPGRPKRLLVKTCRVCGKTFRNRIDVTTCYRCQRRINCLVINKTVR